MSRGKQRVPTFEELDHLLQYDPDTGVVKTKVSRGRGGSGGRWPAGRVVGYKSWMGYLVVNVAGSVQLLHRVIFVLMTGEWPKLQVDHIDGDRTNNRWGNLRLATPAQQRENSTVKSHNMSGFLGVSWRPKRRTYLARIRVNRKQLNLGYFKTAEEAHEAYLKAKRELHTFQPVPRTTTIGTT